MMSFFLAPLFILILVMTYRANQSPKFLLKRFIFLGISNLMIGLTISLFVRGDNYYGILFGLCVWNFIVLLETIEPEESD